jgi:hypothetical protein
LMIAAVSFVIGFKSGVATAPGGGDAPGDGESSTEVPRRAESPKRDSLGHDTRILFGKYRGWTYQEFLRAASPTYIKWVRDTVRSGNETCKGLFELHQYITSVSRPLCRLARDRTVVTPPEAVV